VFHHQLRGLTLHSTGLPSAAGEFERYAFLSLWEFQ
jgi:hypothetical protein